MDAHRVAAVHPWSPGGAQPDTAPAEPQDLTRRGVKSRLAARSLVELKGPTDNLAGHDILLLLSYGLQYMAQEDIEDPDEVRLFTLSDHVSKPFRQQAERLGGRFIQEDDGVWRVEGLLLRLYCIEAGKLGLRPGEHVYEDFEMFEKSSEELLRNIVRNLPDKLRYEVLGTIPQEERLRGLGPEDRLKGLGPEDRLKGLGPEDRLKGLTPEERARLRALLDQNDN